MVYNRIYSLFICIIIFSYTGIFGQDNAVGIGQWRSHLSYESMVAVTESEDAVFFGSTQAVLKINKEDQSLEHLNKVSGLSDMRIKTIEYNRDEKLLVIAYINGNIDLLYDNGIVTNLPAILNNNNVIGDKSINHIFCSGKQIYLSCSFGLVVYDLDIDAFSQTTFTPSDVNACARLGDTLFIATNQGIYQGILDGRNLLDFEIWELQDTNHGLTMNSYSSRNLILFNDKIYAAATDTLFQYHNGRWQHFVGYDKITNQPLNHWIPTGSGDFVPHYNMTLNYSKTELIIATNTPEYYVVTANNDVYTKYYSRSWRVKDIVIDQDNIHWAADEAFIHRNFKYIKPNAPVSNLVSDMHVDANGTLWVTSSPYNSYQAYFSLNGFSKYKDGEWTIYNPKTNPQLDTFYDPIRVTSNPENQKIYIGSFMSGLLEIDGNDQISIFNQYNSPLEAADGDPLRTRIMGLAVDEDGVLWGTNSRTYGALLTAKKLNGDWKLFPSTKFNDYQVEEIVIDRNGYKWIKQITGRITVFDSGELDNDTDDRSVQLGDNNTVLPNNEIKTLKADKQGVVWVGTNEGITIFNCSSNLFDEGCNGNRPVIQQDNFNGYLLEGEEILDIEVDGANRKWVATKNGLFLLSSDGYNQLAYLTSENSPLFDNEVTKLAIDGKTGTLYIATGSGIQSLRTEATTGLKRISQDGITIFPHPVEPNYSGAIAINNLPDEANVKVTDISGRLVYETTALGGQAIWNGMDYNGRKAQSGVYLVFIVNEGGTQKAVGKILFMN